MNDNRKQVSSGYKIMSIQDAFRKFPDPSQSDVVSNDVKVGRILLEILAEFHLADASFVHFIIPHVCKWEAAVAFEVIF